MKNEESKIIDEEYSFVDDYSFKEDWLLVKKACKHPLGKFLIFFWGFCILSVILAIIQLIL